MVIYDVYIKPAKEIGRCFFAYDSSDYEVSSDKNKGRRNPFRRHEGLQSASLSAFVSSNAIQSTARQEQKNKTNSNCQLGPRDEYSRLLRVL
jgi:hypothetical protein